MVPSLTNVYDSINPKCGLVWPGCTGCNQGRSGWRYIEDFCPGGAREERISVIVALYSSGHDIIF